VIRFRQAPSCRLTELPDETGVILHLERKFYFTLNQTAVFVFKALNDVEQQTPEALAKRLSEVFEVDEATAAADVMALLDELLSEGVVERGPESAP
jgi:hypothetical protein